jgi:pimeloyl-ACP methyl ester carboxylesterase
MDFRSDTAPAWFMKAIAAPTRSHFVDAAGARIHYLSWNHHEVDKPGLVFMHGFRGHARWWGFIAPYFTERFRVYALDFSGMGQSEGRPDYDPVVFAHDIAAVVRDAGLDKATLVGHSFGGGRLMRLCGEQPGLVDHAIVVDSYVHFLDNPSDRPRLTVNPRKLYATYAEAKARYRLTPPETSAADWMVDYIAHHSIEEFQGGYRWRFADNLALNLIEPDGAAMLQNIRGVKLTYLYGAHSRLGSDLPFKIVRHIEGARGPIAVPEAHHHVMLDEPLALVAMLRGLLF